MDTIYIVAIIAAAIVIAIVGVVWLLRDRLTSGYFSGSAKDQSVEAKFEAAAPKKTVAPSGLPGPLGRYFGQYNGGGQRDPGLA